MIRKKKAAALEIHQRLFESDMIGNGEQALKFLGNILESSTEYSIIGAGTRLKLPKGVKAFCSRRLAENDSEVQHGQPCGATNRPNTTAREFAGDLSRRRHAVGRFAPPALTIIREESAFYF